MSDELAGATDSALPPDCCGGPGYVFGGSKWGLVCCADCNDDDAKPEPKPILVARLTTPPEPWRSSPWAGAREIRSRHRGTAGEWSVVYFCDQCGGEAVLGVSQPGWWTCRCLAVAETEAGVVVLKFPQPLPGPVPFRIA